MYFDSAYLAKFYVNEPDSAAVRDAIRRADIVHSSAWARGEVACALHRHMREGGLNANQFRQLLDAFERHVEDGVWELLPVSDSVLRWVTLMIRMAPAGVYIRAGDAIHLATAKEAGEAEIWSSGRHLLAAAPHFGLKGRKV